jgi:hypothetical protein
MNMNLARIAVVVVICCSWVDAENPATAPTSVPASAPAATRTTTTSPASQKASDEAPSRTLEEANARRDAALRQVREQYIRDLSQLRKQALRAENLEQANAITAAIEEAGGVAQGREKASAGQVTRINVQAREEWQRGVAVRKGDVLSITASGKWCVNDRSRAETTYGPDGLRADGTSEVHGHWAVLMARIGFRSYLVGKGAKIVAPVDGVIEFRSNDFSTGDNFGAVAVTISKLTP